MINFVDKEWREDLLNTKARLDKRTIELLTNGPKSYMQSLYLGTLYNKWLKMKGLWKPTPPPPDVSSNLKDSLKRWEDNYG